MNADEGSKNNSHNFSLVFNCLLVINGIRIEDLGFKNLDYAALATKEPSILMLRWAKYSWMISIGLVASFFWILSNSA